MADIKSAREIALEKAAQVGDATDEERLQWKYAPEGETLANKYLRDAANLVSELNKVDQKGRKYFIAGASKVLIRNITIPKNDAAKKMNKQAMDGLKQIKTDKVKVENVYSQIRYLFNHYAEQGEQQRQAAYQSLKGELEARLQQAIQQQGAGSPMANAKIDIERQPQFQQEWHKLLNQLDSQYLNLLAEYKKELAEIP